MMTRYTGVTVDTNFNNISKLPRYAKFGKISEGSASSEQEAVSQQSSVTANEHAASSTPAYKPSRRVRTAPGGDHTDIFALEEDDALAQAPPREESQSQAAVPPAVQPAQPQEKPEEDTSGIPFSSSIKPSRRVREQPGGKDSISSLWGNDDDQPQEFKPTRRVRDAPGGRDNISALF
ncbi:hypothetical protein CC2G_005962 [Coprinopsis cinerea AmutBmut pab1-1]|nr:hypothetical protein CC2G_005962 [Coprinopsis cinerea AmutBmut pab1-1]